MKIILDAFGGDHAPLEILKGARLAVDELGVEILLCGDEEKIKKTAAENNISLSKMGIAHAPGIMPVEASPTGLLKEYSDSSMAEGFRLLTQNAGDAFVTAGSTGAAVVGSAMIVKRIKGIKRPAIGTVIPTDKSCYILLDAGANAECRPEMLCQFGIMGSVYMQNINGVKNPRIAIVNIGAEENKGTELQIEAAKLLKSTGLNFTGNIEARHIPLSGCDVAVCDGFTGNIVLKLTEGMAKMMAGEVKNMLLKNGKTKLAALLLKDSLNEFKAKLDYTEHGGAPLLGVKQPVIKAHGSSNAKAVKNAVRQAKTMVEQSIIEKIETAL